MPSATSTGLIWIATLVAFVAMDATWLSLVAFKMFQNQIGAILRPEPMLGAAIAFYLIYSVGLVTLAVRPAVAVGSLTAAAAKGAMLGLTAYATFDLTNLAVIRGWTVSLAVVDIAWGVVASALAAVVGCWVGTKVGCSPRHSPEDRP